MGAARLFLDNGLLLQNKWPQARWNTSAGSGMMGLLEGREWVR